MYISEEEFNKDIQMATENPKKYKRKYDIYNCIVEGCPLFKEYNGVDKIFKYKSLYNSDESNYVVEILS
jgi:hypothetical protein